MEPQLNFRNSPRSLRQPAEPWAWGQSAATGGNNGRGTDTQGLDASTEPNAIGLPPAYAKQLVVR